jgi:hypothetical protein
MNEMKQEIEQQKSQGHVPLSYRLFAGGTIIHAAILFLIIWLPHEFSVRKAILLLGWLWLLWPIVLLVHPARSLRRWLIPVGIATLLLIPCWFTIVTITIWSFNGFAP